MVLPELRPRLRWANMTAPRGLIRFAVRRMPVPRSRTVAVSHRTAGAAGLRIYTPRGPRSGAGLLWIHGGGMMIGDARQDEALCISTVERLGVVVVSVNYRLAPEHPFPAPLDDAAAAWSWFVEHAHRLGVDPARIAVGGESAGAGLAAGLVQRLTDEAGAQPVGQWLFAPMLDDRTAARRDLDAAEHFVWDNESNLEGWSAYLGVAPGSADVPPYASPARRDDLSGLPPAFITWGDIELFADENRAYAEALERDGVPVTVDVVAGAAHGFENWAKHTPVAQALIRRAQDWLGEITRPA